MSDSFKNEKKELEDYYKEFPSHDGPERAGGLHQWGFHRAGNVSRKRLTSNIMRKLSRVMPACLNEPAG
jgi:hypothetical protein